TCAFSAGRAPRDLSERVDAALFRRNGLSHNRKHSRTEQRCPAWNSRTRPCFLAQTTPPRSRFIGITMIIHDNIDNFLAAGSHGDLSEDEHSALHAHLNDCAGCRTLHQETKLMDKLLEENLA